MTFVPSIDAAVTKAAGSSPGAGDGGIGVPAAEPPTAAEAGASAGLGSFMVASVLVDWSDILGGEFRNFLELTGESL